MSPFFVAVSGPHTLATASRIADSVVFGGGLNRVEKTRSRITEGVQAADLALSEVESKVAAP